MTLQGKHPLKSKVAMSILVKQLFVEERRGGVLLDLQGNQTIREH